MKINNDEPAIYYFSKRIDRKDLEAMQIICAESELHLTALDIPDTDMILCYVRSDYPMSGTLLFTLGERFNVMTLLQRNPPLQPEEEPVLVQGGTTIDGRLL